MINDTELKIIYNGDSVKARNNKGRNQKDLREVRNLSRRMDDQQHNRMYQMIEVAYYTRIFT